MKDWAGQTRGKQRARHAWGRGGAGWCGSVEVLQIAVAPAVDNTGAPRRSRDGVYVGEGGEAKGSKGVAAYGYIYKRMASQ